MLAMTRYVWEDHKFTLGPNDLEESLSLLSDVNQRVNLDV